MNTLAFVDVETTGMRPTFDRIIEIGIIRVENGKTIKKYNKLINPNIHISPFIQMLTGITIDDVYDAEPFEEIKDEIYSLLDGAVFVAHNVRFDYSFIRNEFKRFGIPFSAKQMCTVKLSRQLYPQYRKHNLTSLIERHNLTCKNRHRAYDDAYALWQFYKKIKKEFNKNEIFAAINFVQRKPTLPKNLDPAIIDNLPESHGVYKFYDKDGVLLYIGKSNNIHSRVLAHFSNDYQSLKQMKMCQHISYIEWVQTAGELGALLRESHLIKTLQPMYNRQLRQKRKLTILRKITDKNRYDTIKIETLSNMNADDIESIMGVFKSKKQAKEFLTMLVKKYSLCEKILGIDSSKKACFAHKLNICKGACINIEKPKMYNLRFLIAFTENRCKPWFFEKPIKVIEKNELQDLYETFKIDKWCILENSSSSNQDDLFLGTDYLFDLDTYKILYRHLTKKRVNVL